ncbi:MAG: hypothetical protein II863_06770, partial [Kiritimatiellae bacterium]|nr:hypothetical protein [Kiritimatiellia bacterium]
MNMKTMLTFAAVSAVAFALQAETVLWHFGGRDGQEAPATIADVSGSYSLVRAQLGPAGSYTTQLSQSDSQGSHLWWRTNGATETSSGASGSVQLYRCALDENNATNRYYGARYSLTDSTTVKTLFPTNSAGEILPFTLEVIFKAEPYDATLCVQRNFNIISINRRNSYANNVFRLSSLSGGAIYLACDSRQAGNGDVCSRSCINELDFRDGEWHHVALVYALDEANHQGTMNVYFDYALKDSYAFNRHDSIKCLRYTEKTESDQESEGAASLNIGEINGNNNHVAGLSVDEVRLTQSAIEVDAFLHATFEADCKEKAAGTIARWTFDAPGRNGETVGSEYGAIPSVDGVETYGLRGGTHAASTGSWGDQLLGGGDFAPVYTNDVSYAYIWDPGARRVVNPDNATSVFFKHASEDGAATQAFTGSVLNTSLKIAETFPSNFTFECFMKCDKSFQKNVSGLFGFFNGSAIHANNARYVALDLPSGGTTVRLIESSNSDSVKISENVDDGNWHHVAANFDVSPGSSRTITLWVDYNLTATKTIEGTSSFDPSKVAIAFGSLPGDNAFSGFIDEPRITIGNIGVERFLRQFTPRADRTGVWLVPTNSVLSGKDWYSSETDYLEGAWESGDLALSGNLPRTETYVKIGGERIRLSKSIAFSGNGGMTIPCAATVGS